jgi:hypothetical protein
MRSVLRCAAAVVVVSALAAASPALPGARLLAATAATPDAYADRVDAAFLWAFPMYEMARARWNAMVNPLNPQPSPVNGTPFHKRKLVDHRDRDVTTPNNDTLYSATWLDLHATPVRLRLPRIEGGRYWSVALLDIYSNNFAVLGREHDGEGPIEVAVAGPDWRGPAPSGRVLRAPTNDVQVVARFLVDGPADAAAVHRIQDGFRIEPLDASAPLAHQWVATTSSRDPANFLAVVNEMLARNPVPAAEREMVRGWRELGIGAGADALVRTSPEVQAAWRARLPALHERLRMGLRYGAREVGGWSLPAPAVGEFGQDWMLRAAVANVGLSALSSREAIYLNLESDPADGSSLDGRNRYRLHVPGIEARGFWSLSMYEKDADGRMYFAANPISRHAIGDRTPGVKRGPDGAMDILLQHDRPDDAANWLPTPAGPMALTLRVYLPSDAMRRGEAPLPVLQRVD